MMRNIYTWLIACCLSLVLYSCKNDTPTPIPPPGINYDTVTMSKQSNVSYGADGRHKMDVYLPAKRNPNTPFIIMAHGGSWVSGDKSELSALQDSLMNRGIASASMNYRYASDAIHYEQMMADIADAIAYIKSQKENWIVTNDKLLISGYSAGAHLALLYAYKYDVDNEISAVISCAGPTDITDIDWLNYLSMFGALAPIEKMVGAKYTIGAALPDRFSKASPITGVKDVPTLLIHGTSDIVVSYNQSERLHNKMQENSFTSRLVPIASAGHDLGITIPANLKLILDEMTNWINTYGK